MVAQITPSTSTGSTTGSSTTTQVGASGGNQTGSVNNQQTSTGTQQQSQTGQQAQSNTYLPWQSQLQQEAGSAAGNYITSGAPPPGVTGADAALTNAYTDHFDQYVAPQIAAAQGPGSSAIGSTLALGLEQLDANVYGTNLSAYQNAIAEGGNLGFNAVGQTGNQGQTSTGVTGLKSTNNTQTQQDWQQAMTDLVNLMNQSTSSGTASAGTIVP